MKTEGPKIIATCPECGPQNLAPTGMHLTVYSHGENHTYEFFCPTCFDEVLRPASQEVVDLLHNAGVRQDTIEVPLEVLEHPAGAPPLTVDDLMDFVTDLRYFGRLVVPDAE